MDYSIKKEMKFYRLLPLIFAYFFVLIWEIVKANVTMLRFIVLDKYENEPELVRFKTTIKDESCKVMLANSITLTPGTITVDVSGDTYLVHCFDRELAEGMENSIFVRLLTKIEKIKCEGENVRLTDRIVCSNMAGTVVIMIIAILSQWIGEGYLADICIIYAAVSFVAVVVLYKVYTNKYRRIDIKTLEVIPSAKAKIENDNREIMTRRNRYKKKNTQKRSKKRVRSKYKGSMEK